MSFTVSRAEAGYLPRTLSRLRGDVVVFAMGLAAITHCYSDGEGRHRDVFKSKYLSVLDFVFGNSGFSRGAICHVPSSNRLLQQLFRASSSGRILLKSRRSVSTGSLLQVTQQPLQELQTLQMGSQLDIQEASVSSQRLSHAPRPMSAALQPLLPLIRNGISSQNQQRNSRCLQDPDAQAIIGVAASGVIRGDETEST